MKAIRIDDTVELIEVDNELTALQKQVGGLIETVGLHDGAVMIVNEEGLLLGMKQNPIASLIARTMIYGPAVVTGTEADEFDDVPERYLVWLGLS